jgi:hypothetical protein
MSDNGQPSGSALNKFPDSLSSMTVGEFRREFEKDGCYIKIVYIFMDAFSCNRPTSLIVWNTSLDKETIDNSMPMEDFIKDGILANNVSRRERGTACAIPYVNDRAVTLRVEVAGPNFNRHLNVKYTPHPSYQYPADMLKRSQKMHAKFMLRFAPLNCPEKKE